MIKAVLFDLDGTLVNSLKDLATGVNHTLAYYGYPVHAVDKYRYFAGDGIPKMIERALPENSRSREIIEKCRDTFLLYYGEHYADYTAPYIGVPETVSALKAMGIKLAVVSNKAQAMADIVVSKLYPKTFDIVAGKRENYNTKPDPALTLEIIKELSLKPCECLFCGDSGMDMQTAVRCGAVGVGVLWGFRTREELLDSGAEFLIDKPESILKIVKDYPNVKL